MAKFCSSTVLVRVVVMVLVPVGASLGLSRLCTSSVLKKRRMRMLTSFGTSAWLLLLTIAVLVGIVLT